MSQSTPHPASSITDSSRQRRATSSAVSALSAPHTLRTNGRTDPLGVDTLRPQLSWKLSAPSSSFEVQVFDSSFSGARSLLADEAFRTATPAWSSGRVRAKEVVTTYDGPSLGSRTTYSWRVRTWGDQDGPSEWSALASFETGILQQNEWTAAWIAGPERDRKDHRTLYFRGVSELPALIMRARAYVTALGWYRLFINGQDVTGHALVPRWTPFSSYAEYQVYDVTSALQSGANLVGVVVADGRFRGALGILHGRRRYGTRLAALVQVEVELADGSTATITSGNEWTVGTGRIVSSDPKDGERVDFRIDDAGWNEIVGSISGEGPVEILTEVPPVLVAEETDRVEVIGRLPGTVTRTPAGVQLIDFGQNFAGVARVRLSGPRGNKVKLEYSEVLTPAGELDTTYIKTLGSGKEWFQRDQAVLSGGTDDFTPWFTIHGFRYVAVHGLDRDLRGEDVEGIVLSSRMDTIATFTASDPRLEQLWRNALWSLWSNFTDTATDCPTRERSGWTGDIQIFGPTALQVVDAAPFLNRYLRNVEAEQGVDGTIPPVIPAEDSPGISKNWVLRPTSSSVGWGDVSVMLPWSIYTYRGDTAVLARQYDSARAWVDQMERRAAARRGLVRRLTGRTGTLEKYILDTGFHFGEWLRPGTNTPLDVIDKVLKAPAVIGTAYLAHSSLLLSQIAGVLGHDADAAHYRRLSDNVRRAWRAAFVRDQGARIGDDHQDDYVRALAFDLLQPAQRPRAAARLVELVEQADFHLGTGFLSTPMLLPTLVDAGYTDVAFRVLLQETPPSWLGQIAKGATTIWETWEGYKPDGKAIESHNHYAFGAVVQFLQERLAGLAPAAPGYSRITIAPVIGGGITHAGATVETPYGLAESSWKLRDGHVHLRVVVPVGVVADVHIGAAMTEVGPGTHEFVYPLKEVPRVDRGQSGGDRARRG